MLFSATFPKEARALAKEYLDDSHVRIRVGRVGSTHLNIRQSVGLKFRSIRNLPTPLGCPR